MSETSQPKKTFGAKMKARRTSSKSRAEGKGTDVKQVRLRLVYIDFWSALKLSFLLGLAQLVVVVIATLVVYLVFVQSGLFQTANDVAGQVLGQNTFDINSVVSIGRTVGIGAAVGAVNLIVITVLGAVSAIIYNAAAKVVGGLQVGFTNEPS